MFSIWQVSPSSVQKGFSKQTGVVFLYSALFRPVSTLLSQHLRALMWVHSNCSIKMMTPSKNKYISSQHTSWFFSSQDSGDFSTNSWRIWKTSGFPTRVEISLGEMMCSSKNLIRHLLYKQHGVDQTPTTMFCVRQETSARKLSVKDRSFQTQKETCWISIIL